METAYLFSFNAVISTKIPTLVKDAILDIISIIKEYARSQIIYAVLRIEKVSAYLVSIIIALLQEEHVYIELKVQVKD